LIRGGQNPSKGVGLERHQEKKKGKQYNAKNEAWNGTTGNFTGVTKGTSSAKKVGVATQKN